MASGGNSNSRSIKKYVKSLVNKNYNGTEGNSDKYKNRFEKNLTNAIENSLRNFKKNSTRKNNCLNMKKQECLN